MEKKTIVIDFKIYGENIDYKVIDINKKTLMNYDDRTSYLDILYLLNRHGYTPESTIILVDANGLGAICYDILIHHDYDVQRLNVLS